jgi:hypothetical protein
VTEQASNRREQGGNGGTIPPPEHRFKPGQSGNPKGRPKGSTLTEKLRRILDVQVTDGVTREDVMHEQAIKKALKGDHKFYTTVCERLYGKVKDSGELDAVLKVIVERVHAEQNTGDTDEEADE